MESNGIPPKHRTFLALLKSCGIAGRVDEAYDVSTSLGKRDIAWLESAHV
jgi:pentatricopeptide repeat protein